jgi:NAD(P)H-flavin reductase
MTAPARLPQAMPPDPMAPRPYRVVSRRRETHDVVTLGLEPVDAPGSPMRPGQFNMIYAFGIGEVPISVSGDPATTDPVIHTIRAAGLVTRALCESHPGAVLGLRGPFGTDWGVETAAGHDLVIVGGGIGVAPLRPVIYSVLKQRERYGHVSVLIGARSPADLLYASELQTWRSRFDMDVRVTVDTAGGTWRGPVGVVTELIPRALFDPGSAIAFVCGPEIMIRFAARSLVDHGLDPANIRVSLERNMKCAIGLCGHCQLGSEFVCRDGPVFAWARVGRLLAIPEV